MQLMTSELDPTYVDSLRREFASQGYAVAQGLFSPEEVGEIRDIFDRAAQNGPVKDSFEPVGEAEAQGDPLKMFPRYMHPHRTIRRTRDFLLHPGVMQILESFFGHEPLAVQSMFYYKPPGARGQAMHQDNFYLLAEPHTCVAAWTAIDDIDPENGGMYLVPHTDTLEISCPEVADSRESFTTHLVRPPAGKKAVPCIMKAGDTLFFNGNLLHGSGPNRTKDRFRRSFIGHYVSGVTDRISHFYMPMLTPDGREVQVEVNKSGGACGQVWEGAQH
jgi:ectoine hydroxylase-related dioxygenase (phytanoyl-CoA dioxygenase family)